MHVAICVIKLDLPGIHSLKEKRSIVKSILARLGKQFNVATAEIEHHDVWQTAVIALATVGNDSAYLQGLLEQCIAWIESMRPDLPISSYTIEFW
jgi:uncharacterized protein YlxP (DUF503 family)